MMGKSGLRGSIRYIRRPISMGRSPFELIYVIAPRLTTTDPAVKHEVTEEERILENVATLSIRADRIDTQDSAASAPGRDVHYSIGDNVLIAHEKAFNKVSKWSTFKSVYYGPCVVTRVRHPRYHLISQSGQITREIIHASRLHNYG